MAYAYSYVPLRGAAAILEPLGGREIAGQLIHTGDRDVMRVVGMLKLRAGHVHDKDWEIGRVIACVYSAARSDVIHSDRSCPDVWCSGTQVTLQETEAGQVTTPECSSSIPHEAAVFMDRQ